MCHLGDYSGNVNRAPAKSEADLSANDCSPWINGGEPVEMLRDSIVRLRHASPDFAKSFAKFGPQARVLKEKSS
jgi:hypothetical protein